MPTVTLAPPILKLDLNFKQGTSADIVLTVVDANGQIITNTAGYLVRAQIRRTAGDVVLFEWATVPGPNQGSATLAHMAGPPESSLVTLTLTDEQTAAFAFTLANWDLFLTNPIGQSACLAEGTVRVDPYITH